MTQFKDVILLSDFDMLTQTIAEANTTVNELDAIYIPFSNITPKLINTEFIANNNTFGLFMSDYLYLDNQEVGYNVALLGNDIETIAMASYLTLKHHFLQFSYDLLEEYPDEKAFNSSGLMINGVTRNGIITMSNKLINTYNEHINAHADIMDAFVK